MSGYPASQLLLDLQWDDSPRLDGFEASCFDGCYVTGDVDAALRGSRAAGDAPGGGMLSLQGQGREEAQP